VIDIFSSFGLAAAAGLNAYLPLLIIGLLARYTDLITLSAPWNTLENPWVLAVLAVLLIIEMTVDKVPAADSVNDVIQTAVRPVAGAILFASSNRVITDVSPVLAMICGLLAATSIHAVKATARPLITGATAGLANPAVSTAEDVVCGTTTLVAVLLPALAAIAVAVFLVLIAWWLMRRRRRLTFET
jgi:hypothetical protein